MTDPALGDVLGRYRLDREIGRGGMGIVYLARDTQLERSVALKIINPDISAEEEFRTRFLREMRIAAQLEHPHIVPVYEAGEIDGLLFIAMRYIDGEDLRTMLRRDGGVKAGAAATLALQLGAALDAAHARGLVHRDVKPANVLLGGTNDEPHLYLSDFGLAREAASDTGLTNTGNWMGTIDYVAPEQLDGGLISARTDIYAMGCVLYEMVTGEVPFDGTIARKLYAHTHEPLPSVSAFAGALGPGLDNALARACAKDPGDRYASTGDLGRAFAAVVRGQGIPQEDRSVATGVALAGIRTAAMPSRVPPSPRAQTVFDPKEPVPPPPAPPPSRPTGAQERPAPKEHGRGRLIAGIGLAAAVVAVVVAVALATGLGKSGSASKGPAVRTGTTPVKTGTAPAGIAINLDITAPHDGSAIATDRVTFRGTIQPANATVFVQGQPAAVGQGIFTGSATLHGGTNHVDVLATAPNAAPLQKTVIVVRTAASPPPGGATASTIQCDAFATHADDGSEIPVDEVTASNTNCYDARALIDALPAGRKSQGWTCPLTGDRYDTRCTKGKSQVVTWHTPSGKSQITSGQTQEVACPAFDSTDSQGAAYVATPTVLGNTSCDTARAMINSGPQGRKDSHWTCPLTGDTSYTACTRADQRVEWSITY